MTLVTKTYPTLEALREAFEQLLDTPTCLFWPTQEEFDLRAVRKHPSNQNAAMYVNDTVRIHHDAEVSVATAELGYWAAIGQELAMNYGPCLCGAYDCPRCFPGSTDIVECALCEKRVRRYTLQETKGGRLLCEECYEQYERDVANEELGEDGQ